MAGLHGPVDQVAQRRADGGAERDEQDARRTTSLRSAARRGSTALCLIIRSLIAAPGLARRGDEAATHGAG